MVHSAQLLLREVQIKNFRCFDNKTITFNSPLVLIQGLNGAGKTSLLEALHYACYLRSFRTHLPRDLVQMGYDGFFVRAVFDTELFNQTLQHEVQVGFSGKKRLVKVDQRPVSSYKELMDHYRVVTLTEDDLSLISGGPESRRAFLDQAILLCDPEFITTIRAFKATVDSRNAMLASGRVDKETYAIWTEQLWHKSRLIQDQRRAILTNFETEANILIKEYFGGQLTITLEYQPKGIGKLATWEETLSQHNQLLNEEARFGRTLFGAHLDDFQIKLQDKRTKNYASRGQQKFVVLLLKITNIKRVTQQKGPIIFLLDDFMTDFDSNKATILLNILTSLSSQLIFTSPLKTGFFEHKLLAMGAHKVKLTA